MKAKMIKVSAAVTADVLFILQAVGTNLLAQLCWSKPIAN